MGVLRRESRGQKKEMSRRGGTVIVKLGKRDAKVLS